MGWDGCKDRLVTAPASIISLNCIIMPLKYVQKLQSCFGLNISLLIIQNAFIL
jgi:hypothetical protein